MIAEVLVLFVELLRFVVALAVGLILSTRPTKCQVSVPPRGGRIYSCCGKLDEPQAYYWTGTSCAADTFCQCDSTHASPEWPTLRDCERAHRGCPSGEAPVRR